MANILFNLENLYLTVALPNAGAHTWQFKAYLGVHILALVVTLFLLLLTIRAEISKAQTAIVIFEIGALLYVIGFIQEIISDTAEGGFISCISQYLGESIVMIALVFFVSEICYVKIKNWVFVGLTLFSLFEVGMLAATRTTGLFYHKIGLFHGKYFTRPEIDHGIFFFVFVVYIFMISTWVLIVCLKNIKAATPFQKKRLTLLILSLFMCWLPYVITLTGITNGFEIPSVGISLAAVVLYFCFEHYGFFDSHILAGANALEHGKDGILVVDAMCRIKYENHMMENVFGTITENDNILNHPILSKVLSGEIKQYEKDRKIYEFEVENFKDRGFVIGHMIWMTDSTEHFESLKRIRDAAIRDTLTGLYNRSYFQEIVEKDLDTTRTGAFVMFDLDDFKSVNDTYGHQVGDGVLNVFADVIKRYDKEKIYSCRIGGDEFCVYIRKLVDDEEISIIITDIFNDFRRKMEEEGYQGYTSLSAGVAVARRGLSFKQLYAAADKKLYEAKTGGKNTFVIEQNVQ